LLLGWLGLAFVLRRRWLGELRELLGLLVVERELLELELRQE
jgi:hypothetical protein